MGLKERVGNFDSDLAKIEERAEKLLSHPIGHFTDHSISHCNRIINILDSLTIGLMSHPATDDPSDLQPLNSLEVFILLAATYLHDIGMHCNKETENLLEIRAKHHEYSSSMIIESVRNSSNAYYLAIPANYVDDIALVARGHRKVNIEGSTYTSHYDDLNTSVRVGLLSALLRFGDELDITYKRVDIDLLRISSIDVVSQMHWWKHHYVQGLGIQNGNIRVDFRLPDSDFERHKNIVPPTVLKGIIEEYMSIKDWLWVYDVRLNVPNEIKYHKLLKRSLDQMPEEVIDEMQKYTQTVC